MQRAASSLSRVMPGRQERHPLRLPIDGNISMSRGGISIAELDGDGIATTGALDILESDGSALVTSDVTGCLAPTALTAGDDDGIIAERSTLTFKAGLTRSLGPSALGHIGGPAIAPLEGNLGAGDGERQPDVGASSEVGRDPAVTDVNRIFRAKRLDVADLASERLGSDWSKLRPLRPRTRKRLGVAIDLYEE